MKRFTVYTVIMPLLALASCSVSAPASADSKRYSVRGIALDDSIEILVDSLYRRLDVFGPDTIHVSFITPKAEEKSERLTNRDYREVADKLGIEAAAVKAIVEIETGRTYKGFHRPGKPIINFDLAVYRRAAARRGIDLNCYTTSHAVIFRSSDIARYGTQQEGEQARLDAAMSIDSISAIDGTFWGLFQIGGFNWKLCGTSSRSEFVELMSRSERDQLDLFAEFIRNSGLLKPLKKKDWTSFARGYNGAGYYKHNYHTRLESAYRKYRSLPDAIPGK